MMIPVLVLSVTLAGLLDPPTVVCHLWKRLEINEVKQCIYRGPNKTFYTHFVTHTYRECPPTFNCPYNRQDKTPSVQDILRGINEGFSK